MQYRLHLNLNKACTRMHSMINKFPQQYLANWYHGAPDLSKDISTNKSKTQRTLKMHFYIPQIVIYHWSMTEYVQWKPILMESCSNTLDFCTLPFWKFHRSRQHTFSNKLLPNWKKKEKQNKKKDKINGIDVRCGEFQPFKCLRYMFIKQCVSYYSSSPYIHIYFSAKHTIQ